MPDLNPTASLMQNILQVRWYDDWRLYTYATTCAVDIMVAHKLHTCATKYGVYITTASADNDACSLQATRREGGGGPSAPPRHCLFTSCWPCRMILYCDLQATYAGLPDFLTKVVESELTRIPSAFARGHPRQRWTIVYLPQARTQSLSHLMSSPIRQVWIYSIRNGTLVYSQNSLSAHSKRIVSIAEQAQLLPNLGA